MSNENDDVFLLYDKITNRLIDYINNNYDNQVNSLNFLKTIYNFIKSTISKEKTNFNYLNGNDNPISRQGSKNIFFDNDEKKELSKEKNKFNNYGTYQFIIHKLKRRLKEQHEQFKLLELGYLDRISTLQKKLRIYEESKSNYFCYKTNNNKSEKVSLINSLDNKKSKYLINTNSIEKGKEKEKEKKRINISLNKNSDTYKNKFTEKKNFYQTYNDLKTNKKIFKEIMLSNMDFNEDSKIQSNLFMEKNYFLNNYIRNSKIRNKNINIPIKYNFKDIKKEIEDNKRIVRYLKDGNTPQRYRTVNFKI
jgi:hypothetical protein